MSEPSFTGEALREFSGCDIQPLEFGLFMERMLDRLEARERPLLVGHHNLHSLYLVHRDADVRRFYSHCEACYIDGMGALWLLRAAGMKNPGARRFSLMDKLPSLLSMAQERDLRIFYLGSSEECIRRGQAWIGERWPQLSFRLHHGYLNASDNVLDSINAFGPDLLFVGMGMPRQERWIVEHLEALKAGIVLQAGGSLDYYTGLQVRPPETWSRIGLGWLHRLLNDPGRLWRRYLITPFGLLRPAARLRSRLGRPVAKDPER